MVDSAEGFIFASYLAWAKANLLRPIILFVVACLVFNLPTFIHRVRLTIQGVLYLIFCNDKSWKKPKDPASYFNSIDKSKVTKKTVVFVRHGESTWNDTFNKGSHRSALVFVLGFIPGLIKSVLYETYLVLSGKVDSWFYDSPLSYLGLGQVDDLGKFLGKKPVGVSDEEAKMISILRGDAGAPESKILCSSLRRAISTMAAGFRERLSRRPGDKILVIPSLQEISRNPDTLSITPAQKQVTASWIDKGSKICDFQKIFTQQTDMSLHKGNKPIKTNGLLRMNEFCDFVFSPNVQEEYVIVGGHSIWFRSFFRTFIPYNTDHVSKKRKVVNAGCVSFTLLKATTNEGDKYMVDPQSVQVIYGGF
eukprot:CAMPEP_0183310730 /NCGR_PEP_ID=MMETSP0160_2-20130417/32938_1 /TAXON_ID=2839 ORGANISM="Odontella Sinensis, Strain Grunow 1884" /NCGR_SAMPLE_ID=MMETSP0160_2 /ASSEMBLY_ACC=CAM_ASM_000250 /LENGTH=363 /DNA_ID=CAMNT_0025475073 /DNA_START=131 /DNA_END=1222 /DNA_ORIENTATION=+